MTLAVGGLIGAMNTTPWYVPMGVGLLIVMIAAGFFWGSHQVDQKLNGGGCLSALLGLLGLVFALTGIVAILAGLFGGV